MTELAAQMEGSLMTAKAAHARALAAQDDSALEAVSIDFEQLGADLLAAEAAADAAVAQRKAGRPRPAAGNERRAVELAGRCEGVITPSLQAIEGRARLTRAEREVALSAAAGRSNKEIARRLGVSVRTVENHLQRVYEKLGISTRIDLGPALNIPD
jgi:DNA-binding CsgD family transcriptional regulator